MGIARSLWAMLHKNFIIKKRLFWRQTFWEIIIPMIFGFTIGISVRSILKSFP